MLKSNVNDLKLIEYINKNRNVDSRLDNQNYSNHGNILTTNESVDKDHNTNIDFKDIVIDLKTNSINNNSNKDNLTINHNRANKNKIICCSIKPHKAKSVADVSTNTNTNIGFNINGIGNNKITNINNKIDLNSNQDIRNTKNNKNKKKSIEQIN